MVDHVKRVGKRGRMAIVAVAVGIGLVAPASAAAAQCADQPVRTVFAPWNDQSDYFLAPGGDFEGWGTSWSGGSLVGYTDPFYLSGGNDRQSLRIEAEQATASPWFCADVRHPDFRFVSRPLGWGALEVHVRFHDKWGGVQTWQMYALAGYRGWSVSPRIRLVRDLPLPDSGMTQVQLIFRARSSAWAVDDVYIDPYRK